MNGLLTTLAWLLVLSSFAQAPLMTPPDPVRNRFILKVAPLAALDPEGTYEGALEFLPTPHWSIQQGLGYGNSTILPLYRYPGDDSGWQQVWRARTEVRWYRRDGYAVGRLRNSYWALEFLFKRVHVNQQGNVGRECLNGDCAYFQRISYRQAKDVYVFHLKNGWQESFGRWQWDFYYGIGVRQIYVFDRGLPADAQQPSARGFRSILWNTPSVLLPSLSAGVKVGWLLGKLPVATPRQF